MTSIIYVKEFIGIRDNNYTLVTRVYYSTGKVREYTTTIPQTVKSFIESATHVVDYKVHKNGITVFTLYVNDGFDWDYFKEMFTDGTFIVVASSTDDFITETEILYCANDVEVLNKAVNVESEPIEAISFKQKYKIVKALYRTSLRDRINAYNDTQKAHLRERHKRIIEVAYIVLGKDNAYKFLRTYGAYIIEKGGE